MATLSYQKRTMGEQVLDNVKFVSADYAMSENDQSVYVDASGGNVTITLPNVAEAKGRIYCIVVTAVDTTTVTVTGKGDTLTSFSDVTLDAAGAEAVLYSDGINWHKLV